MDVSDQTGGIAYMVGCKAQATFGEEANLTLSHRLSKVRVYIDGVDSPTSVAMVYPSGFTITEGEISPSEQNNTILMYPTTVNGKACYEATVAPGAMATSTNSIIVMQGTIKHEIFLDNNLTLEAGKVNEVKVTIKGGSTEITPSTGNISGNGSYLVTGDYNGRSTLQEAAPSSTSTMQTSAIVGVRPSTSQAMPRRPSLWWDWTTA